MIHDLVNLVTEGKKKTRVSQIFEPGTFRIILEAITTTYGAHVPDDKNTRIVTSSCMIGWAYARCTGVPGPSPYGRREHQHPPPTPIPGLLQAEPAAQASQAGPGTSYTLDCKSGYVVSRCGTDGCLWHDHHRVLLPAPTWRIHLVSDNHPVLPKRCQVILWGTMFWSPHLLRARHLLQQKIVPGIHHLEEFSAGQIHYPWGFHWPSSLPDRSIGAPGNPPFPSSGGAWSTPGILSSRPAVGLCGPKRHLGHIKRSRPPPWAHPRFLTIWWIHKVP